MLGVRDKEARDVGTGIVYWVAREKTLQKAPASKVVV